jgi:putative flippase GtrA
MRALFAAARSFLQTRFFRFIVSGVLNSAISYACYLGFLQFFTYQISYSIAYVVGIGTSYLLNRVFVFKAHQGVGSILLLPLVYVFQYIVGLLILWILVEKLGLSSGIAPLVVMAVMIPLTFVLTKIVFLGIKRNS